MDYTHLGFGQMAIVLELDILTQTTSSLMMTLVWIAMSKSRTIAICQNPRLVLSKL